MARKKTRASRAGRGAVPAGRRANGPGRRPPRSLVAPAPAEISDAERLRAREVLRRLRKEYPRARVMLDHRDPWELLVATILAAQCTDARVNMVTPELFRRYPAPAKMAAAPLATLEKLVRSTGFFRNKAKALKGSAAAIVERHGGAVPRTMEEMLALPGVARKTANVVLMDGYGLTTGVVVDTHNLRLTGLLRFVREKDPAAVERFWMAALDRKDWNLLGHLLYDHGQRVCVARRPDHGACVLKDICPSAMSDGGRAGEG